MGSPDWCSLCKNADRDQRVHDEPSPSDARNKRDAPSCFEAPRPDLPTDRDQWSGLEVNGYVIDPRADLKGAKLKGAQLAHVNLRGADLTDADLSGADIRGADLRGAGLTDTDLSGADLRGAYLSGAELRGAGLTDADLSGADLRGAQADKSTSWPDDFDPVTAGVTFE